MATLHRLAVTAALLGSVFLTGCYAETGTTTVTSGTVLVEDDGYYVPAYYDGYLVYYDTVGHPYYYDRGTMVWIAPASPHYVGLVQHWDVYGPRYHRWYGRSGYRYREYRRAPGYHTYRTRYR